MPLKKGKGKEGVKNAIAANIRDLKADNKKSGKERGANGKLRSNSQILAIAIRAAKGK
jgi:hypothetical protein